MNGLYPIIRRIRRPLVPVDRPADAKAAVVTVVPAQAAKPEPEAKQPTPKKNHGKTTSSQPAE